VAEPSVLIATPDYPPRLGGIQVLVNRLARNLRTMRPHVVTFSAPGAAEFDVAGGIPVTRISRASSPALSALRLNAAVIRTGMSQRPDVVLSAHIVTSPAAVALRTATGAPVAQFLYGKEIGARERLARFAIRHADRCVAISRYCRDLATSVAGDGAGIEIIHPGVDLPTSTNGNRAARFERPTIVTVARLEDTYKGHDVILRAMPLVRSRVPGARWLVVGDGPLRPHLEELATTNRVSGDGVEFLGAVPDARRDEILARSHVFAMPSREPAGRLGGEGFGIVFLEAGLRRLAVVAGAEAGVLDSVVDGETGLLVDPRDHVALADAISAVLLDGALADRLGAGGEDRAKTLAWPHVADRVEELLLALLESRRPA
jgi:phosphatidyl-myo-inositol dimannoside synthase